MATYRPRARRPPRLARTFAPPSGVTGLRETAPGGAVLCRSLARAIRPIFRPTWPALDRGNVRSFVRDTITPFWEPKSDPSRIIRAKGVAYTSSQMPSRFGCPHAVALGAWPLTDPTVSCRSTVTVVNTVATPSNSCSRRLISIPPEIATRLRENSTVLVTLSRDFHFGPESGPLYTNMPLRTPDFFFIAGCSALNPRQLKAALEVKPTGAPAFTAFLRHRSTLMLFLRLIFSWKKWTG